MTKLLILGAGGHGRVVADCAQASGQYEDIAFLDDGYPEHQHNLAWPVINKISAWPNYQYSHAFAFGMGDNFARFTLFSNLNDANCAVPNIIHPSAVISPYAHLGKGNVILANSVINPNATVENAVIINTQVTVEHDCYISNAVHLSPRVALAGTVTVKPLAWLGIGSCVIQQITIAEGTQTGAGSVIICDTQPDTLYVGTPAIPKKKRNC